MQVGTELRRFRLAARKTAQHAADHLGCGQPKISKIERGALGIRTDELRALLAFYGVAPEHADSLVAINEQPRDREWWAPYRDGIPNWFRRYMTLEAAASQIRSYEIEIVPGLLQTEDYARATLQAWEPEMGNHVVKAPLEARMARQRVLVREDPLDLVIVLTEAALRKIVWDAKTMRGQLVKLLEASELPNVDLRVLPFNAPQHPVQGLPFSILHFPEHDELIVYVEDVEGASYVDKPAELVGRYNLVFTRLRKAALDENESRDLIATIAKEFT